MTERIRVGLMILEDGTQMPESVAVETAKFSDGWSTVLGSTSTQLGKEIEKAGWTFFYMAGEIHANGYGFNEESREEKAMAGLIESVKRQNCNCLEVTQIRRRSFFGLPCTSVTAHARHIQKSRSFHSLAQLPKRTPLHANEWLYNTPSSTPNRVLAGIKVPEGALTHAD